MDHTFTRMHHLRDILSSIVMLFFMVSIAAGNDIEKVLSKTRPYHSQDLTHRYLIEGERVLQAKSFINPQDIDPLTKMPRQVPENDITCRITRELHLNFTKECLRQSINDEEAVLPKGSKAITRCLTAHNGLEATYLNTNSRTGKISKSGITDYSIQKGPGIGYAYFDEASRPILYAHGILCANNTVPTNGKMIIPLEISHFVVLHTEIVNNNHSIVLRTVGEKMPHDYWCSSENDYLPVKVIEYYDARTMSKMNEYNINYIRRAGVVTIDSWTAETHGLDGTLTHLGHFKVTAQSSTQDTDTNLFYIKHEPGMSVASRKKAETIHDNSPLNADFYLVDKDNQLVPAASVNYTPYFLIILVLVLLFAAVATIRLRYRRRLAKENVI
jgi:hypothetical protein